MRAWSSSLWGGATCNSENNSSCSLVANVFRYHIPLHPFLSCILLTFGYLSFQMCDGDRTHHQDQARELAQAVQKAVAETNASDQQNVTVNVNVNFNPVYNYGGNISLHSSHGGSSSSISSNNSNSNSNININQDRRVFNNITVKQDQPLQIQTDSFLRHTVYDSDEVYFITFIERLSKVDPPKLEVSFKKKVHLNSPLQS